MQIENRSKNRNHLLEFLIPFYGVLEPYKISIIPVTAIVLFAIVLSRADRTIRLSKQMKPYLFFVVYMTIRDVFHMFSSVSDPLGTQFNRLLESIVLYGLIFLVCNNDFDEDVLFKSWKIAGLIFGAGMLYHVFQIFVLNQEIYPISILPGYNIANEAGEGYGRPTSFFSEPAAYVVSMLPLLFLSLKKRNFKWAAITTFLVVVSTSTVGVILCAVLWMSFILLEKKSLKITVLYSAFVVFFVVMFVYLPIFSDALQKLEDVSAGESTWGSRVKGPFQMIAAMNWYEFPFGTTILDTREFVLKNIDKFARDSSPVINYLEGKTVFLNTICMMIYRYGILGLWFYLGLFKGKLFERKYEARMYAIMLIVASFGQGSVASPAIPMLVTLLYTNKMEKENAK